MKAKSLIILALLFTTISFSQSYYTRGVSIDKYKDSIIKKEFDIKFDTDEKKTNFKHLREFLTEKEDIMYSLNVALPSNVEYSKYMTAIDKKVERFKTIALKLKDGKFQKFNGYDIEIPGYYDLDQNYGSASPGKTYTTEIELNSEDIDQLIKNFESAKREFAGKDVIAKNLSKNIENVKQDIYDCRQQIDSTLAPEYKKQDFATNISICFTIIIGILLISFFLIVYLKSDKTLSKDLLSGYGLQFITLFVLIIAIILFGILGILQSSELAAILSGISGYILGKGIEDKKSVGIAQATVTNPEGSTATTTASTPRIPTAPTAAVTPTAKKK